MIVTVLFAGDRKPYSEIGGEEELWQALERVAKAAHNAEQPHSAISRGWLHFEPDRLHMLKPATMRNWCRTAALNDADAIFEHLVTQIT